MLTATIVNTSGVALTLPGPLSWITIAIGATVTPVINPQDLLKVVDQHSGFTLGEMLQQLKQKGSVTIAYGDLGATSRDHVGTAIATQAT